MTRGVALGCLCVGLVLPLTAGAESGTGAFHVSGWIEPDRPLTDVCVIWGYGKSLVMYYNALHLDGTFPANTRTHFSAYFEFSNPHMSPVWPVTQYGLFGLHDSANDGVSMALQTAWAQSVVSQNLTWPEAWRIAQPPTQAGVANWLRTRVDDINMTGPLGTFESAYGAGPFIGREASLVDFSTPSAGGSALVSVAIVPEPATLVFATFAGAVLLPRRRRAPA